MTEGLVKDYACFVITPQSRWLRHLPAPEIRIRKDENFYRGAEKLGRGMSISKKSALDDPQRLGYFKVAQIVSALMIVIGIIIILLQARKPKLTEMYQTNEKVEIHNF